MRSQKKRQEVVQESGVFFTAGGPDRELNILHENNSRDGNFSRMITWQADGGSNRSSAEQRRLGS